MTYLDAITEAIERTLDVWDEPLPAAIAAEAAYLSGEKSASVCTPGWR